MSGQATGWVLRHGPHPDHVDRHGEPYGARARGLRFVLHAVADAANRDGEHAHPGIDAVADGALYGRRQTINLLNELIAEGWLQVEEEGGGKGRATVYRLPRMAEPNSATVAPTVESNGATATTKGCNDDRQTVQPAAETVHSRVHPNGLATVKNNVEAQRCVSPDGDKPRRATSFPAEFFLTPEMRAWAADKVPTADVNAETEQFCDYHRAKGDTAKDWTASWRTWMRNAVKFARGTGRRDNRPQAEIIASAAAKVEARRVAGVPSLFAVPGGTS